MSSKSPVPYESYPAAQSSDGPGVPAYANGAGGGGGPQTSIVKRTLTAFLRYKWMILAILVLGTGAGFVARNFQVPEYQTSGRFWINPGIGGVGGPIQQGALLSSNGWQGLLTSSTVLDTVILRRRMFLAVPNPADSIAFDGFGFERRSLKPGAYAIAVDPAQNGGYQLLDASGAVVDRGAFGDSVGRSQGFRWVPPRSAIPVDRAVQFSVLSPGDVFNALSTQLVIGQRIIQGRPDDNFMNVSLRGADRLQITATLEDVMLRFDEVALELKKRAVSERTKILKTQLDKAQQELVAHESARQNFEIDNATAELELRPQAGALPPGTAMTTNTSIGVFFQLQSDRDQLSRDSAAIRRALREHPRGGLALLTALEAIPTARNSTALSGLVQQAFEEEANLRALRTQYTDLFPSVQDKIGALDTLYQVTIPQLAGILLSEMDVRETGLDAQMTGLAEDMRQIPPRMIAQQKLQRQVKIAEDLYEVLEKRYQESVLAEVTTSPDIEVIDWPKVPFAPVSDSSLNILLMIIAGSLGLGLALAFLRDRMDPRFQYPDQVSTGMGLNILGAVPALRGGRLGATDMALAVESFRSIQLSLTHAVGNGGPLMVTFSSPGASDGKSFITSNLAIAFADMGHRTLVIDGDVRRGSMHKLLGATHKPGLTEFLTGRADRTSIIQETRYPLLHFIACGSRQEAGPKMLGSPIMRQLIRDLRADFDVILVDSPPLGACVDPMILATLTRNLVLVMRSGTTDRSLAESKLDMLDRLPVRVVGAVLNDVEQAGPYRYYSYVSGYEVLEDEGQPAVLAESTATGDELKDD